MEQLKYQKIDLPTLQPIGPDEHISTLWALTALSLLAWMGAQIICASLLAKLGGNFEQSPQAMFATAIIAGLVVAAAALIGVWKFRPQGIIRIGIAPAGMSMGIRAGALASVIILPVVGLSVLLSQAFFEAMHFEHPSAHPMLRSIETGSGPMLKAALVLLAVFIAPVGEELLFRGQLQTAFRYTLDRSGRSLPARGWAIIFTSLIFTLFHGELWMMPPIFILSLCLGYVYERCENLWATMTIHALFNASNVILYFWTLSHR